jgi:putative transposase
VPTVGSIDSQSIKIAPFIDKNKGIDGGKKVNGRKRHIITDTHGLVLGAKVGAANEHDGKGGTHVYMENFKFLSALVHVFGDNAYGGVFRKLMDKHNVKLEIAAKQESTKGFVPVAVRWVTECTFGWFNFYRRLSKDYERNVENSVSVIYIAQIQILLNRLTEVKN